MNPSPVEVCEQCKTGIDLHRASGRYVATSIRVGAHGRVFCSMLCADEWEKNPANAQAVRESHARARELGWPYDPEKL